MKKSTRSYDHLVLVVVVSKIVIIPIMHVELFLPFKWHLSNSGRSENPKAEPYLRLAPNRIFYDFLFEHERVGEKWLENERHCHHMGDVW